MVWLSNSGVCDSVPIHTSAIKCANFILVKVIEHGEDFPPAAGPSRSVTAALVLLAAWCPIQACALAPTSNRGAEARWRRCD